MDVAKLAGFKWIINGRGYANIVTSDEPQSVIYGLAYDLTPSDVAALDENEGVPHAYTKEVMAVEFWRSPIGTWNVSRIPWKTADVSKPGEMVDMLVYIDRKRVQNARPKDEYVYRMNKGIADAMALGVPMDYVEEHMRRFISSNASEKAEELAKKQAISFEEEEVN